MKMIQDHFSLFGLPRRFAVDMSALDERYRELQREVHPDRFATAPAGEQRASMELATRVNDGYRTLKWPLARARYLLELAGVDAAIETNTAMPAEFLAGQMEWREALDEASSAGDATGLDRLDARLRKELDAAFAAVEKEFDRGDAAAAAALVRKLMFLDKLREEIGLAQERLDA
jgi:molecular chaperone HscB